MIIIHKLLPKFLIADLWKSYERDQGVFKTVQCYKWFNYYRNGVKKFCVVIMVEHIDVIITLIMATMMVVCAMQTLMRWMPSNHGDDGHCLIP
jgi:hypothetical protein